jgi:hypothetical protein
MLPAPSSGALTLPEKVSTAWSSEMMPTSFFLIRTIQLSGNLELILSVKNPGYISSNHYKFYIFWFWQFFKNFFDLFANK